MFLVNPGFCHCFQTLNSSGTNNSRFLRNNILQFQKDIQRDDTAMHNIVFSNLYVVGRCLRDVNFDLAALNPK